EGPRDRRADRRRVQGRRGRALAADGRTAGRGRRREGGGERPRVSGPRSRMNPVPLTPTAPAPARPGWLAVAAYVLMLAAPVGLSPVIRHYGEALTAPDAPAAAISVAAPKAGQVDVVAHVLATLAAVVALGYVLGRAFAYLGQPPVIGEVVA